MDVSEFTDLVVVSSASWLAKDFAAPGTINVVPSLGFELPSCNPLTTAWWCSGIFAARADATGVTLPLLSAGPRWMDTLPFEWTGRKISSMPLSIAKELFTGGFIKPAEIKVGRFPANVYQDTHLSSARTLFLNDVGEANLPDTTIMSVSEPVEYVEEYRCFVAQGQVTAVSAYLIHGITWDAMDEGAHPEGCNKAVDFTNAMLAGLGSEAYPPGFVVDVGLDSSGRWSVIEANASWSSNPYHSDMSGVIESVLAAHDAHGKHQRWAWKIDPYHKLYARPLPLGKEK